MELNYIVFVTLQITSLAQLKKLNSFLKKQGISAAIAPPFPEQSDVVQALPVPKPPRKTRAKKSVKKEEEAAADMDEDDEDEIPALEPATRPSRKRGRGDDDDGATDPAKRAKHTPPPGPSRKRGRDEPDDNSSNKRQKLELDDLDERVLEFGQSLTGRYTGKELMEAWKTGEWGEGVNATVLYAKILRLILAGYIPGKRVKSNQGVAFEFF